MKIATIVLALALWGLSGGAQALEVRFYPTGALYAYELDAAHGASSLLVHNIAIVNNSAAPVTLTQVQIELRAGGETKDTRNLGPAELSRAAAGGSRLQQSGMYGALPFLFGGDALLPAGTQLSPTQTLAPGEALVITWQVFAFRGARDEVRVRAIGDSATGEGVIPISSGVSETQFVFPLQGVWLDGSGPSFHTHHRWAPMEQFAGDFLRLGADNKSHRGDGTRFRDYYAYGEPVFAGAAGTVATAADSVAEDASAMRQRGETVEAYLTRLQGDQMARIALGALGVIGNHVVIDHGNGEFSIYAHLKPGSVRVRAGQHVEQGEHLGDVGSSGNSTEPHLHFQVCNSADPLMCAGIPPNWTGLMFGVDDPPRAPQSGDFLSRTP